jgi:hypothetical protein
MGEASVNRCRRAGLFALLLFLPIALAGAQEAPRASDPAGLEFFEKRIRPILHDQCRKCHGPEKQKGGLRVDLRSALLKGGDSGPAVVPGDPEKSLLLRAVRQADGELVMPPPKSGKKLADPAIRDLVSWIKDGAPFPVEASPSSARHWAFLPIADPPLPAPVQGCRTSIDRFVFSTWRQSGLLPGPAANRRTLLRRATFDLTGLPPTSDEVERFEADPSPEAFDRVIDRLLDSPAYGEKWGRKWLDLVHYADTAGENSDHPVPNAWRYRNWVIEAYNRDLPYDQFLREQLAGDLLARTEPRERARALEIATGLLAVARRFGHDTDRDMHLTYEDVIDTLGKSVLGLTLGCARCHNHKYDPVTTRDYYALYGIFASTRFPFPGCEPHQKPRDLVPLPPPADAGPTAAPEFAYGVVEGKPADARIQLRGEPDQPGDPVPRRNLELLGGQLLSDPASSGRLDLARWLTDPANPLTARVLVNRIWQGHFGRGLVETPSDFGSRGARPSDPELLDHLASRFREGGYRMKAIHRLILRSAAYQLASEGSPRAMAHTTGAYAERGTAEPRQAWFPRRRLDAEEIRDALLAVSGELDRTPGREHPFPPEEKWAFTQHNPFKAVYDTPRRSVYLMTQRIQRHPFLGLFDGPDTNASTARREVSTVPTQALFFLNDPFVQARAEAFARRLHEEPSERRIDLAHRLAFERPATELELASGEALLAALAAELSGLPPEKRELLAWTSYLRTLLGSNEFITVD